MTIIYILIAWILFGVLAAAIIYLYDYKVFKKTDSLFPLLKMSMSLGLISFMLAILMVSQYMAKDRI